MFEIIMEAVIIGFALALMFKLGFFSAKRQYKNYSFLKSKIEERRDDMQHHIGHGSSWEDLMSEGYVEAMDTVLQIIGEE